MIPISLPITRSLLFSLAALKIPKTTIKSRNLTQVAAKLRVSPTVSKEIICSVAGAPEYTVVVPKSVGCELAGRDLGSETAKVDLVFYGGCHFALGIPPLSFSFCSFPNYHPDKRPECPCLMLPREAAVLMDRDDGAEIPAVLVDFGVLEGSGIALKGTEGGKLSWL
jgi:hypothetical protein